MYVSVGDRENFKYGYPMILYSYLPPTPLGQDMTQGQFLSGV